MTRWRGERGVEWVMRAVAGRAVGRVRRPPQRRDATRRDATRRDAGEEGNRSVTNDDQ
jgi:hypothetical protein